MAIDSVPLLTLITFVPLVGAVLIAFIPRENPGLVRAAALMTALSERQIGHEPPFRLNRDH